MLSLGRAGILLGKIKSYGNIFLGLIFWLFFDYMINSLVNSPVNPTQCHDLCLLVVFCFLTMSQTN